jgi:ABC-type transport system involved in cytochrome bd biosynthesis fused ATPase/permease subunit
VTLATLREQVSKLSQFPFFMKRHPRERPAGSRRLRRRVEEACKLAHIHESSRSGPGSHGGYDTVVTCRYRPVGQKRLIANGPLPPAQAGGLLLDEPTENLDADQRVRLTRVIREYALERTCIVISHDMDFIAAVSDRILVLNGGTSASRRQPRGSAGAVAVSTAVVRSPERPTRRSFPRHRRASTRSVGCRFETWASRPSSKQHQQTESRAVTLNLVCCLPSAHNSE